MKGSKRVPDSTDARVREVQDAIKRMNSGRSPGMDGVKLKILKWERMDPHTSLCYWASKKHFI